MISRLIIFISSTADLVIYRDGAEKVLRVLEVEGSRFEAWPSVPSPSGAMAECLRRLRETDAVIVILGEKYGTVTEDGLSATHMEYRHARTHRKPVLPFVLQCPRRDPEQARFLEEVERDHFRCRQIKTVQEFKRQLKDCLLQEFTRCFRQVHGGPPSTAGFAIPAPTAPAGGELFLSDDPRLATEYLKRLYESQQEGRIHQLATQIELKFIDAPEIMNILYMAEVNLAMAGAKPDEKRLEAAIRYWDAPRVKRLFASYSLAYNQGNALGALKRYPEAIARYEAAISEKPDFAPCWKNLGTAHVDAGDRSAAQRCFRKAVEYSPHLFEARYSLATIAAEDHAYEEALSHLAQIRLDQLPNVQQSWVCGRQAISHHLLGNHPEAIHAIEAAIALAPDTEWTWEWAGRIYSVARRADRAWVDGARRFGERLVSRFPDKGEAWGELGYTYWRLRQEQESEELSRKGITAFSKAIELGFLDRGLTADRLGHLHLARGEAEKAEAAFRLAAEQAPSSFGYCLGVCLIELARYEEALRWLMVAAEKHQPDAMSWGNVAFCYDKAGKKAEAIAAYKKAIDIDPTYATAWFNLGGMYWNDGNAQEAMNVWREAVSRFPDHELVGLVPAILRSQG